MEYGNLDLTSYLCLLCPYHVTQCNEIGLQDKGTMGVVRSGHQGDDFAVPGVTSGRESGYVLATPDNN